MNESPRANYARVCDHCGKQCVTARQHRDHFLYGADEPATLTALYNVWTCENCGFAYTEEDAETARHAAVCSHLGVLTPQAIRDLRTKRNLTQAALAAITGLGEASIKRWETGATIQNASSNLLLRLVEDDIAFLRIRELSRSAATPSSSILKARASEGQLTNAAVFQLRRSA